MTLADRIFYSLCNLAFSISIILLVLLPLRPVLDRFFLAKGRTTLWYGLFFSLWITLCQAFGKQFGVNSIAKLQFFVPYARLVWTEASSLPRLITQPLPPPAQAAQTLQNLPAGFTGDIGVLELAAGVTGSVPLTTIFVCLWLAGFVAVLSCYFLRHAIFIRSVKRWSLPASSAALLTAADRALEKIKLADQDCIGNLDVEFRVLISPRISGPMVAGGRRPMLLFPHENYSETDAYYICLHEMTHWKNQDLFRRRLYVILNALFWFVPPVWLMRWSAYRDMELCCDETVLTDASSEEKTLYCQTLLRTVPPAEGETTAFTTYFRGSGPSLWERLHNIWRTGKRRDLGILLYMLAIVAIMAITSFGVAITPAKALPPAGMELVQAYQSINGEPEGVIHYTEPYSWERTEEDWLPTYLDTLLRLPEGHPLRITGYHINRTSLTGIYDKYTPDDRSHTNLIGNFVLVPAEADSPWFSQKSMPGDDMPGNITLTMVYELVYEEDGSYLICVAHAPAEKGIHYNRSLLYPDYEDKSNVRFGVDWG